MFSFEQIVGVQAPEKVQDWGDQSGPAGLVACPEPSPVVTLEILVKHYQVAPVRVFLEFQRPALDRPPYIRIAQENARQPAG